MTTLNGRQKAALAEARVLIERATELLKQNADASHLVTQQRAVMKDLNAAFAQSSDGFLFKIEDLDDTLGAFIRADPADHERRDRKLFEALSALETVEAHE